MTYRFLDEKGQHLHQLTVEGEWKPLIGGSTAKGIIGKGDGLVQWAADCSVDFLKENRNELHREVADYGDWQWNEPLFEQARKAWVKKRNSAATKGTERHSFLEDYVRTCLAANEGKPMMANFDDGIGQFVQWSIANVDRFLFAEANCYSERMWVGGIADIGMVLKDGRRVVGDHKSSKMAYFDQHLQAALYDVLLSESGGVDKDGNKLFDWAPSDGTVIFPFRSQPFTPSFRWKMDELRKAAEEVVHLYKLSQEV